MNQQQKYIRLAHILTRLKTGEDMGIPELQKSIESLEASEGLRIECGVKTLQRDIMDLRKMGCPIVYRRALNHQTYELRDKNWELPSVPLMCGSEIFSVILGSRLADAILPKNEARKITSAADNIIKANTPNFLSAPDLPSINILFPPMSKGVPGVFDKVYEAWRTHKVLNISYQDEKGSSTQRTIEPQLLFFYEMNWYVRGFCYMRNAARTFALIRIESASIIDREFQPQPELYEQISFDTFDGRDKFEQIVIRLTVAGRQFAMAHVLHSKQKITANEDGTFTMTVPEKAKHLAVRWILSQLGEATAVAPAELVDAVHKAAMKIAGMEDKKYE